MQANATGEMFQRRVCARISKTKLVNVRSCTQLSMIKYQFHQYIYHFSLYFMIVCVLEN